MLALSYELLRPAAPANLERLARWLGVELPARPLESREDRHLRLMAVILRAERDLAAAEAARARAARHAPRGRLRSAGSR